jgi:hypothetical protein
MTSERDRAAANQDGTAGAAEGTGGFNPEFFRLAGRQALQARQFTTAARLLERYRDLVPDDPKSNFALAVAYAFLGEYRRSCHFFERAAELRPDHLRTQALLGNMLFASGRPDDARAAYQKALRLPCRDATTRFTLGTVRLLHGDYPGGWHDLESRWAADNVPSLPFRPSEAFPLWDGSEQPGATLCLHNEGGFGDAIMYARLVPRVAPRVGRILLRVPSPLPALLRQIPGIDGFVEEGEPFPDGSLHASLWSLPALTGLTLDDIPGSSGYLSPPLAGPLLKSPPGLRIGLAWVGNPDSTYDRDRTLPSHQFLEPLVRTPGISWQSLQLGPRSVEAAELGLEPMPPVSNFADTAFVVSQLDLVITVDTSIGHLCGALGIPTWIMIPSVPEYRWLLDRDDSPWYDSVRLFRRSSTDDWEGTIGRITDALVGWISGRGQAAA